MPIAILNGLKDRAFEAAEVYRMTKKSLDLGSDQPAPRNVRKTEPASDIQVPVYAGQAPKKNVGQVPTACLRKPIDGKLALQLLAL
jgi:hypothetical protein